MFAEAAFSKSTMINHVTHVTICLEMCGQRRTCVPQGEALAIAPACPSSIDGF